MDKPRQFAFVVNNVPTSYLLPWLTGGVFCVNLVIILWFNQPFIHSSGIIALITGIGATADSIIAFLLVTQYQLTRRPETLILAWTFGWLCLHRMFHAFTYPGVFDSARHPLFASGTTSWTVVWSVVGYIMGILWFTKVSSEQESQLSQALILRKGLYLFGSLLFIELNTVIFFPDRLTPVTSVGSPTILGIGVKMLICLGLIMATYRIFRIIPATDLLGYWLRISAIFVLLFYFIAAFSSRNTLGAYIAHLEAALASCFLLIGLLNEVQQLYQQAVTSAIRLEHKKRIILRRTASLVRMTHKRDNAEHQAQLAQDLAERMSGFLDITSHELRTPLTSVIGYLGLLERYLNKAKYPEPASATPEKLLMLVENCSANAFLINQIIADLIDSARPHGTLLLLAHRQEDISSVVSKAIESCSITFHRENIIFKPAPETLPLIFMDSQRIYQVIYNFVKNATKFSPPHLPITVAIASEHDALRVSVTDYGIGVPADKRDIIWEKFTQLASDEQREGWGLGLFLCKTIVEAHGGTVGVDSIVQQGATFWFTLPLVHSLPQGSLLPSEKAISQMSNS
jgi:signal transduction histidine kinase